MRRLLSLALLLFSPSFAFADANDSSFDTSAGVLKTRRGPVVIPIDKAHLDPKSAKVEIVPIGEGRQVMHAKIADRERPGVAWESLFGVDGAPIWSGVTGYARGEEGERSGDTVLFFDRDEHSKIVVVAEIREDTRICGQDRTPLAARGLDPATLGLRGATLHRLDKALRDAATPIVAAAETTPTKGLARILLATGSSAPGAQAITDGKADTAWSEQRPGDGHGEFVTMTAPAELPLHSLVVTIAPSAPATPKTDGAAPRTFFVATDKRLFKVTMPGDAWAKPGASFEIPFAEPVRTSCVALVLDEAYTRNLSAPEVTIAEVSARTKFDVDHASLDDVAKELTGPRADEAGALLRRSGDEGLAAVTQKFSSLDAQGRAFAVDVAASSGSCSGASMDLLTRALSDQDVEVRKRALGRIERCGKSATEALAAAVRGEDEQRRAATAPLLAAIAPSSALAPIADVVGKGKPETRRAVRSALARAASSAPREKLVPLLAAKEGRVDVLRALGAKLPELRPESDAAITEILQASPDMPTRWLVAEPLAQLAKSSEPDAARLGEIVKHDPDPAVRARAVLVAGPVPSLAPAVVAGVSDSEPRVREAALQAIGKGKLAAGTSAAATALVNDPWTFVRIAAAEALGALESSDPALAKALADSRPRVRSAAAIALGTPRAIAHEKALRGKLDDEKEDVEVRALAARSLGAMCAKSELDRLTKLAQRASSPADENDERLAMAAIEALGTIHPPDLEKRLAPLRAKDTRAPVKRAVDRALTEETSCR